MLRNYIFISLLCFTQEFIASDSTFFNTDLLSLKKLSTLKEKKKSFTELLYDEQFGNSGEEDFDEKDILDEKNLLSPTVIAARNNALGKNHHTKKISSTQPQKYAGLAPEHRPEMLDEENMMGTDTDLENQKKLKEKPNKKS